MLEVRTLTALLIAVSLAAPAIADAPKPKRHALLVGVTEYKHADFPTLKYTENDVFALEAVLKSKAAGFDSVRVLSNSRGKKKGGEKDVPTTENIRKALDELAAAKGKDDIILVAMSGHGARIEVRDEKGEKPRTFPFFCPADADLLKIDHKTGKGEHLVNLNHLLETLGKSGAGTKLLLLDACRSNTELVMRGQKAVSLRSMSVPRGVAALLSCDEEEFSWETNKFGGKADDKKGHGIFFYRVLEGLRGAARDKRGEVTWAGLDDYVRREVPNDVEKHIGKGARQSPNSLANLVGKPPVLVTALKAETKRPQEPKPDPAALYAKALAHAEGRGERYNPAEAVRLYKQAADAGHDLSKAALAYALARGVGVERNEDEAQKLGKKCFAFVKAIAADEKHKDAVAMALLGRLYAAGLGVDKNDAEALKWYKKGAELRGSLAMLELGLALAQGHGVQRNHSEAFAWYTQAAARDNAVALYLVGQCQMLGRGTKLDKQKALVSLKKAAAAGHHAAGVLAKTLEK